MSEINIIIEPLMSKRPIEIQMTVPGPKGDPGEPADPTLLIDDTTPALDKTYSSSKEDELLGDKVDKVAGKGLSANDYTDAEKQKLEGIETGATADQTAEEIKALYEGNADTNAYTDAEKAKLLTVEANAKDDQAAAEVPITDTGEHFTSADVEGALQEVGVRVKDVETVIKYITIESWADLQQLVREGVHQKVLQIGDQFIVNYAGTGYAMDVIGINHDEPADPQYTNSLTLQFQDCIMNCQFDAPEWLIYAEAEILAGTYYFYDNYNSANYQFTTTQSVPLGGTIGVSVWGDSQNPTEVKTYDASGVLLETLPVVVGSTGTLLTSNDLRRVRYGSNNYLESNVREFLNSEEDTFQFGKQTVYDRASAGSPYSGAGFLKNLDPELKAVIGPVNKQVIKNTVTDGGGQDLFTDTVFLLSRKEVYGGDEGDVTGEAPYAYYEAMAASPTTGDLGGRIKYLSGSARFWWLRSPHPAYSHIPRFVSTTGHISTNIASNANGLAPACTIY